MSNKYFPPHTHFHSEEEALSKRIIGLLKSFADFNILTEHMVLLIGSAFDVEAKAMCADHGITYKVPTRVLCRRCGNLTLEGTEHTCTLGEH